MSCVDQNTNFDSLFLLAKEDDSLSTKQQCHVVVKENQVQVVTTNKMTNQHLSGPKQGTTTRGGSGHGSRGSPARIPTKTTLCPSNPAAPTRSHSCRDQTGHMREKYQTKNQLRRMSIKTPTTVSRDSTPKMSCNGSRNNSLAGADLEVTRQFLATNKKVINRGDSFKKKQKPTVARTDMDRDIHHSEDNIIREKVDKHPRKIYRVAFLGSGEVGKTSIIDQFMSSEHADVYEDISNDDLLDDYQMTGRILTVDVNNVLAQLSLVEAEAEADVSNIVEEHNPDCFVLVYAVDDVDSFESIKENLTWLFENNCLAGKSAILVGNKADLARTRVVDTVEGCDLAVQYGLKFTETSPGMGHRIDELLVGIVMQMRLHENKTPAQPQHKIKQTLKGFLNIFTDKEDEKRKSCRNLNM